jgi:SAM-dependent methyltransferase
MSPTTEVEGVAPDGSPVDVYRRMPPNGEAEIVHAAVPEGAEILELGCGTGRVTRRLVALGHRVVAVDESAEMLRELYGVAGAETVQGRIEELDLGQRFPVVLLGSHLVNSPEPARGPILAAARRHADPNGMLPIEVYPPKTRWEPGRSSRLGDVEIELADVRLRASRVAATVIYRADGRTWRQSFEAELLDEARLRAVLGAAGFSFERWLDEPRGWLLARAVPG